MSMQLPKELEETLSCTSCGHLISLGPVTKSSKGWQCGRCSKENGERNDLIEALASGYLFPCKYRCYGCAVLLPFGTKIMQHEVSCTKKPYDCPTLPSQKCEWQGQFDDIEKHFTNQHRESVLEDLQMEVVLSEITEKRYAFFYKNRISFLVDFVFNKDKGLSVELIRVLQNKDEYTCVNEKYDVAFHCKESKAIFTRNLSSYFLNSNTLKIANNNVFDAVFLKYIGATDEKLLLHFEVQLPVQPLSLNSQEKSLTTTEKAYICACKNCMYGCPYMDYYEEIQKHESTCIVYGCPTENGSCQWRGVLNAIQKHCRARHVGSSAITYSLSLNQGGTLRQTAKFYLFICSRELFRICIKLDSRKTADLYVLIVVQYIGKAVEAKNFGFNIVFKKYNKDNREEFSCETKHFPCIPFTESVENIFDCAVPFCYEQIKDSTAEFGVNRCF